jgi:7-keto-8-aminopelargonate synthetase-like enzyme
VLGPNGEGTAAHFDVTDEVDLIVGTFSKSLASIGGFVAGSETVIHYLKHHARPLIFTAALPPSNTAGVLAALDIMQREPERRVRLWENTKRLQDGLRQLGFDIGPTQTPIVPVLIGPLEKTFLFWRKLFDAGCSPIRWCRPRSRRRSAGCAPASWRRTPRSRSTARSTLSPCSGKSWGSSE